jgi:hypothetical protein
MPSLSFVVGVEPILFLSKPSSKNAFIDIIIQNLSANVLYFTESPSGGIENGLRIAANAVLEIKEYSSAVYFIASGADSDIRICYQEYVLRDKERES